MKKVICLLMVIVSICTNIAFADTSESTLTSEMSQKLAVVKSRIGDTEIYDTFYGDKRSYEAGDVYRFTWETTGDDVYKRLYVTVNNEDVITNHSENEETISYELKQPTVNKMSAVAAAEYAEKLIFQINPDLKGCIRVQIPEYEDLYTGEYSFNLQRTVNGYDVYGDTGYITISPDCSKILHFYLNYTCGLNFDVSSSFISKEQAFRAYKEKLGLKMLYEIEYTSEKTRTVKLVYVPSEDYNTYINAVSGEIFKVNNYSQYRSVSKNMSAAGAMTEDSASDEISFSKAEQAELDKLSDLLTVEETEKILRSNDVLIIPDEAKLMSHSVNKDYYSTDDYSYRLNFENLAAGNSYSVTSDAKTGEITDYYHYKEFSSEEVISDEQAKQIADNAVKKLLPTLFTSDENNTYVLENSENGNSVYRRYVNGVACDFNTIRISVDKSNSTIRSFSFDCYNLEFPDPSRAIGTDEIHNTLFNASDYHIVYMPSTVESESMFFEAVPVYAFASGSRRFDAFEGTIANYADNEKIVDYDDIDGHYASEAIDTLRRFGIGFAGGKYGPERIITQGEFTVLLDAVFNYGHPPVVLKNGYDYGDAYNYAIRNSIISVEDKNHELPLTREMACIMLVKAMGYGEVASLDEIYVSKFDDVTDNIGYISILSAMGIVKGEGNGNFEPHSQLTRADAAIMLYSYLSR